MKAKVFDNKGSEKGDMELPERIFGAEVNVPLLRQVVNSYLSNNAQGTAKAKSRAEVAGGGVKPFRQKGTGRARAGSNASPLWVRGGKAFGPRGNKNTKRKLPKKMREKAMASILSDRAEQESVLILDKPSIEKPQTRLIKDLLDKMQVNGKKNLLIVDKADTIIYLSGRNIRDLSIKQWEEINVYDIINNDNIIFLGEETFENFQKVMEK